MIVCASTALAAALACPPMPVDVAPASAPAVADPEPHDVPPTSPASATATPLTGPCVASWYGDELAGATMANGQPFDPGAYTVATWDHDFGTVLEVHHQGATVEVEVTDRGPARRLGRCLDLSRAAFDALAPLGAGLIDVTYREVGP